jgi:hypothetical protein
MAKTPRLDEVFLVQNRNVLNVGSAYTAGRARRLRESGMKPELEKIVQKHSGGDPAKADMLRAFAHEMEAGEGEDPSELDAGGPPAGTTGRK